MSKCVLGKFTFASSHEPVLIQYNSTLSKMVDLQPKEFGLYFFCPKNLQRLCFSDFVKNKMRTDKI